MQRLRELPPVLIVSLARHEFNMKTYERYKLTHAIKYPLTLDMACYSEKGGYYGTFDPLEETPLKAAEDVDRGVTVWPEDLHTKAKAEASFQRSREAGASDSVYDLAAVIIHSGAAGHGHYHAYIRDCAGEGKWTAPPAKDKVQQGGGKKGRDKGGGTGSKGGGVQRAGRAGTPTGARTDRSTTSSCSSGGAVKSMRTECV